MADKAFDAWRKAFDEAATDEAISEVFAFAAGQAARLEYATRTSDPLMARELALDAIADTLDGVVSWDPQRAPLVAHLCQVIRSRASHDLARVRRFEHISWERAGSRALEEEATEAHSRVVGNDDQTTTTRARAALDHIRELAQRDPPVLMLLDLYEAGTSDREGILKATGLAPNVYANAMRRLRRYARRLSEGGRHQAVRAVA